MKRCGLILVGVGILVTCITGPAVADVPDFITYSGRLTDGTAWGQSKTFDLTFRMYDCGCKPVDQCEKPCQNWPGTLLYEQSFSAAPVEDGYFSVILTGVANVFGNHDQTWITLCVGTGCGQELELLPRQAVGSIPYAVKADRVLNPYCVSWPCKNEDIYEESVLVDIPAGQSLVKTVRCPQEYPIPISGGCTTNGMNTYIQGTGPIKWNLPEAWASANTNLRAGWYCSAINTGGVTKQLNAIVICRKRQ